MHLFFITLAIIIVMDIVNDSIPAPRHSWRENTRNAGMGEV